MDNWELIHPLIDKYLLPYLGSVFLAAVALKVLPAPNGVHANWYRLLHGFLNAWAMNPALQVWSGVDRKDRPPAEKP